jgi:cobalt/nickel transport system permease protein
MMGVMGAFVFAGQMINFTIPATGSSGHIGGGILLAALLGPYPALLTIAAVLIIQCLFFADGGLLALGCNIFNMGVITCMVGYPLIYRALLKKEISNRRIFLASVAAVVVSLQLGAFSVVLETKASGVTELPFGAFVLLMQPIHLAIGVVEGIVTGAVLCFVRAMRPEVLESSLNRQKMSGVNTRKILLAFGIMTVIAAGGLSLFASAYPDGLEWSMEAVAGTAELEREGTVYDTAAQVQEVTAILPDYSFKSAGEDGSAAGTSTAGVVGSVMTLALAAAAGLAITAGKRRAAASKDA